MPIKKVGRMTKEIAATPYPNPVLHLLTGLPSSSTQSNAKPGEVVEKAS